MNSVKKRTLRQRVWAAAVATGLAATVGISVGAAPAQATVWNCQTGYSSVGAWGKCLSGDTQTYKVNVLCQNIFTRSSYVKSGNWVTRNSGVPSTVQGCGAFEAFYGTPWTQSL